MIKIIIPIIIFILVLFSTYFLYLWGTKKINRDIILDLATMRKEFAVHRSKCVSKKQMIIFHNQMELLRNNLDRFTNRFFLNKKQKENAQKYKEQMLNIELAFTKIKSHY